MVGVDWVLAQIGLSSGVGVLKGFSLDLFTFMPLLSFLHFLGWVLLVEDTTVLLATRLVVKSLFFQTKISNCTTFLEMPSQIDFSFYNQRLPMRLSYIYVRWC